MTMFETIKAMKIDEVAKLLAGLQILVIETFSKKMCVGYEVSENEKLELLKETIQLLESEVSSND